MKLLASELDLNEEPLKVLSDAIYNIPPIPSKYFDNYGFLLEMTRDIQADVFYNVIASGSMNEVSKSEVIFNKVQQAYFNTHKAINGVRLSREVFRDYEIESKKQTFPQWLEMASTMIKKEALKVKKAQEMVTRAREEIIKELNKYEITFVKEPAINKDSFAQKMKVSIVKLKQLQTMLKAKTPTYPFLDPIMGNAIASMTDLLAYLENKNPYYVEFNEAFFDNRQVAMHRGFFADLHIAIEEGLREIIDSNDFQVVINRQEMAKSIVRRINQNLKNTESIAKELSKILELGGGFATFNDYLATVLKNLPLKKEYKASCRVYFSALSIVRNKVSHSDMSLSEKEKIKLIKGKFGNIISPESQLQMSFEQYVNLLRDIIRFFDTLNANI